MNIGRSLRIGSRELVNEQARQNGVVDAEYCTTTAMRAPENPARWLSARHDGRR